MRRILLVIDMQEDFVNGSLGTPEAVKIVPAVKRKIEEYKTRGDRVIYTRDTHPENYLETNEGKHLPVPHCILNTAGWQIIKELDTTECSIINKPTFGYLYWKPHLDSDEETVIEIVGLCTDICVISNALIIKAVFPEWRIVVDASGCAGVTPESHQAALTTMKMCQIEVVGE